jgi:DNA-binding MarR family transcriptional regulator
MPDQSPSKLKRTSRKGDAAFLDDFLLYLLARASAEASAGFHDMVRKRGLSVPEWRVMFTLADGPCTVGEMAARTLMQQPTLTKLLDRMASAGTVERRVDSNDGRRVQVVLTTAGHAHNDALMPLAREYEVDLLDAYPPAEVTALKNALRKLIDKAT